MQKYLPGNQHTVLAVKIYIDMSRTVYPTLSFLAFFYCSTYITVRKLQEKNLSSTKTHTRNCQIYDPVCTVTFQTNNLI